MPALNLSLVSGVNMAKVSNAEKEYESALASAIKVIDAILSLDIPTAHMRRYLDRAVWHVTVPQESLKYQTRFVSCEAQKVIETLKLFSRLRRAVESGHRISQALSESRVQELTQYLDAEARGVLEAFAVTNPSRQVFIVNTLKNKEKELRSQLRHEHVTSRKTLIDALLLRHESAAAVLKKAISCTVTRTEHTRLDDPAMKKLKDTDHYGAAGIHVMDTVLGQPAPWSGS